MDPCARRPAVCRPWPPAVFFKALQSKQSAGSRTFWFGPQATNIATYIDILNSCAAAMHSNWAAIAIGLSLKSVCDLQLHSDPGEASILLLESAAIRAAGSIADLMSGL
jgi:hypothetical protein